MYTSQRRPRRALYMGRWVTITAALLIANSIVELYLQVRVLQENSPIIVPIAIMLALGAVVAAALWRWPRRWMCYLAVGFFVIVLAGSLPHDLPELLNPATAERFIFSVMSILVPIAGLAAALTAAQPRPIRSDRASTDIAAR